MLLRRPPRGVSSYSRLIIVMAERAHSSSAKMKRIGPRGQTSRTCNWIERKKKGRISLSRSHRYCPEIKSTRAVRPIKAMSNNGKVNRGDRNIILVKC